jgi:hypothetical protein
VTTTDLKAVHRRFHAREQDRAYKTDTKGDHSNPTCAENPRPKCSRGQGDRRRPAPAGFGLDAGGA